MLRKLLTAFRNWAHDWQSRRCEREQERFSRLLNEQRASDEAIEEKREAKRVVLDDNFLRATRNYLHVHSPELEQMLYDALPLKAVFAGEADHEKAQVLYQQFNEVAAPAIIKEAFVQGLATQWQLYSQLQDELYKDSEQERFKQNPVIGLEKVLTLRGRQTLHEKADQLRFEPGDI